MGNQVKKIIITFFLIFIIYPFFSYSHVNHYEKLKLIEMDILRNGKKIGYNKYSFKNQNNLLVVQNEINFVAKLVGINLLDVKGSSIETYKNGRLIKFKSDTIQNKKKKYNELVLDEKKKTFKINGSSFNGNLPSTALVGNWWNHNILQSEMIISPLSGSLKFQEVYFVSKEILKIDSNRFNTSKFKIIMKKNIKDKKKEEFKVWLDDKSKIILKVSYSKFGDWEYVIKNIKKFN
tara:strand:- start:327 stop:1031 length:705 start_codon:yes stop_codon:yes gene_type:complete